MNYSDEDNLDFSVICSSASETERIEAIARHYRAILELIGENPDRQGLIKTPMRAAKALWFASQGYRTNADEVLRQAIFDYSGSKMIVVKDIEFYSMCEHHILPFFGTVSLAYIPTDKMIGLSKLPRLVNAIARKLQVQERLTAELCEHVRRVLDAKGVICQCTARHLCMQMRGVEKQMSQTVTTDYNGVFMQDVSLRSEFFNMVNHMS